MINLPLQLGEAVGIMSQVLRTIFCQSWWSVVRGGRTPVVAQVDILGAVECEDWGVGRVTSHRQPCTVITYYNILLLYCITITLCTMITAIHRQNTPCTRGTTCSLSPARHPWQQSQEVTNCPRPTVTAHRLIKSLQSVIKHTWPWGCWEVIGSIRGTFT